MTWINRLHLTLLLLLVVLLNITPPSFGHAVVKKPVLDCPVDEVTAVRFFYHDEEDYFHFPLILRAVAQEDPRINTAPMGAEGRTAYISREVMQRLLRRLMLSDLSWQESQKTEALGSYKRLPASDRMEIIIVCSKGTARTTLDPKKICDTLKPLDSVLTTPRALWEFQGFRLNYGCRIPGFKYDAYSDH
jgi:hypothetical protein